MKQTIAFNGKAIQPRKSLQTLSGMNQNKLFNHPNYKEVQWKRQQDPFCYTSERLSGPKANHA